MRLNKVSPMCKFLTKSLLNVVALGLLALPAYAQTAAPIDNRDASFLPPSLVTPGNGSGGVQIPVPISSTAPADPMAAPIIVTAPVAPTVTAPTVAPVAQPVVAPLTTLPAPVVTPAPLQPVAPMAPAAVTQAPVATPVPVTPPKVEVSKAGVDAEKIDDINPEAIGLFSPTEGGLGSAMWKSTPRELVERLMPSLSLPTYSYALNNLAQRFFLTTASVPVGKQGPGPSLIGLRISNLLELGDVHDAWKMTQLAKPELIDEPTLRAVTEAALVSSEGADVCAKLPAIIKDHKDPDWQKLLVVCQLMAKDNKAAQLTIDVLHTQDVHDDVFFYLAERNIIAAVKQLPRQLTPLKPLNLALLRLIDLPLPPELYVRPDAALIPSLLQAKSKDDVPRLSLAEKSAEKGLITATQVESIYASVIFAPDSVLHAGMGPEAGVRLHALLYQGAMQKDVPQKVRVELAVKFLQNMSPTGLNGALAQVLADMVGSVAPSADYNVQSGAMLRIYTMAGKPQAALEWLKQTKAASIGMPNVTADVQMNWPATVFAGLESDKDFAKDLEQWMITQLTLPDPKADNKAQRDQAAAILLLLEADGFAVAQDNWIKVIGAPVFEKRMQAPTLLLEYLRSAGKDGRRGEAALLSLAVSGSNAGAPSLPVVLAVVRALRLVGLTADAAAVAREDSMYVLGTTPK